MPNSRQGAFHLFRIAGIDVFVSWFWLLVPIYFHEFSGRYSSPIFNVIECFALFAIVLLHEFGHSLACRSVGGQADEILLWPLGGVAFVSPPQRPGATLWSIAAGPLVNVALFPVFLILANISDATGFAKAMPDVGVLLWAIFGTNAVLLGFNLLPIYPLDGGQMLRSILWFFLGRARSLTVTAGIGFVGVAGLAGLAYLEKSWWLGLIAAFAFSRCQMGWRQAQAMAKIAAIPRRAGFACPSCEASPPLGDFWTCQHCQTRFDLFLHHGSCPHCDAEYKTMQCLDCGTAHAFGEWMKPAAVSV